MEVFKYLGLVQFDSGTCQNHRVCSGGGKEPKLMKYVLDGDNDEEESEQEDSDFEPEDEEDQITKKILHGGHLWQNG